MRKLSRAVVALLAAFVLCGPVEGAGSLNKDKEGWTVFTPSRDARLIYVSSSHGDDSTGRPHTPNDAAVGANPFLPAGEVMAFRTVGAALEHARSGAADWVLLRRGDTWYQRETIHSLPDGRSPSERFLLGSYGPEEARPLLKTGDLGNSIFLYGSFENIAIVGLHFLAHTRDAESPEFESYAGNSGFHFLVGPDGTGRHVLVEDCRVEFGSLVTQTREGTFRDLVVRRNLVLDAYSVTGHSSGYYAHKVDGMVVEENIFDHNGWRIQGDGGRNRSEGRATMFNHNTYFNACRNVVFRGNMFLRAASSGNKWRADHTGSSSDLVIDENLYAEGEIGIGIGGNTREPLRFRNVRITNNVMVGIGRTQPTGRMLGWYLAISDWEGGLVGGNCMIHQDNREVGNVYGIHVGGSSTRNVRVQGNLIHGLHSTGALVQLPGGADQRGIALSGNVIQGTTGEAALVRAEGNLSPYRPAGNTYHGIRDPEQWFRIADQSYGLEGWTERTNETGAVAREVSFPDPQRTVAGYNAAVGGEPTFEAFVAEVRRQSKANWRPQYTARAVNDYIRAGFGMKRVQATGRADR